MCTAKNTYLISIRMGKIILDHFENFYCSTFFQKTNYPTPIPNGPKRSPKHSQTCPEENQNSVRKVSQTCPNIYKMSNKYDKQ